MGDTLRKSGCQRNTCCNAPLSPQHVSAQRPPRMPLFLHKWLKKNLYAFCFPDQLETLWAILAFIEQPKQICASKTAFTHICHFLLGSFSPWFISSAGFLQVDMQLDLEWKYTRLLCVLECHKLSSPGLLLGLLSSLEKKKRTEQPSMQMMQMTRKGWGVGAESNRWRTRQSKTEEHL